ncbi:MAG TPA: amidohydrolase family protein, partial [Burkholderiales bacterium]|nr:amidohydrolase family protein [Burkholderiales bacterium]
MRIIDLHCYPGTKEWIACQGPYVAQLARYWKRDWSAKSEEQVLQDFTEAGVEAVLVALDLETTIKTPPVTNEYVHAMWKRHPRRIIQAWGALEPSKKNVLDQARKAMTQLGLIGFHFHPIMQHFRVDDRRYYPMFELIDELGAAVMIDVGTTGMGAGMPGGHGAVIRHAHPASIDQLAADFPRLKIIMAHPGWPWVDETTAVALHKGNVYWEMSGWAPKHFPGNLKVDMRGRLQDKIM